MKALKLLFILLLTLSACVDEYTPEVKGVSGIMVVEGLITNGESIFKLSQSVSILDTLKGDNYITDARVEIERNDGTIYEAINDGNGTYRIATGDLDFEKEYRLNFTWNNKRYQSSYLKPIRSAEIDSLSWRKEGEGQPVLVCVNSHAGEDDLPYYRWTYKETWEITTEYFALKGYDDNGKLVYFDLNTANNRYYCWGRDSSKSILLESTTDLKENRIAQKTLVEISPHNEKIKNLYHIEVSQTQLRAEAYNYFRYLRDEVERTGGLFSIVMSAGDNGNLVCLDDPDELIIGYVEVASTTQKSMYIEYTRENKIFEGDLLERCTKYRADSVNEYRPWISGLTYSKWYCVDCRTHYNASKDKPEWWPTDHW